MERLPNFLIIGAMKAGTTTLYDDLLRTPRVYLPPEKEPEDLTSDDVLTRQGRAAYSQKFSAARHDDVCGEASTAYSKSPLFGDVARRARAVLGDSLKVIYILRDPIARIESEYQHRVGLGLEDRPIDTAVLLDESYIAISQYGQQLAAWQAVVPSDQIHVLRFEDYLEDRKAHLGAVRSFLGLSGPFEVSSSHLNASDGKRVVRRGSYLEKVMRSRTYLYRIKPLLPMGLKSRIKALLLPTARSTQGEFSKHLGPEARAHVVQALMSDPLAGPMLDPKPARDAKS